ncbi:MAG: carboxypeptidase regulatory-like domain-containing protein, partial [Gemmatimonadales bacterium]
MAALLALAPRPAHAQIGSGTDIITGVVIGEDGTPVQDATVEAWSAETQVTRRARTDARGRFTILFPDGGGQYRMTVRMIGMSPRIEMIQRNADEDRLVWNVRLTGDAVTLDAINVSGARLNPSDGPTPGSEERRFTADQLSRLPTDATDLMNLAGLVPGVLTISSTDTTATAFSVAGLGPDANALTLDGLLFGNSTIPQEGLRATRVVTNTYDVSLGQFSGGLISSTTRSGSNMVQGSSQYQLRDENLAVTEDSSAYDAGFTQNVFSGGVGGPLIKDKMFLFVSGQARLRSNPQQTLLSAQNADDIRLGVSPDSVARFYHLVDSLVSPGFHTSVAGSAAQANDNYSGLARLDYVLSNNHSLMFRGDLRGTSQDPTRLGALALPQTAGQMTSGGGGLMGVLTSHFGATVLNEMRGYYQGANNSGTPFTQVPAGRVQVASNLPDGTVGVTTLAFGGASGLPTQSRSNSFEASDELSWLPGSGGHRIKLGGSLLTETAHSIVGGNTLGTYTYNSLGDLAAGTPASFSRTLNILERNAADSRWSAYLGDVWVVTRPFQLTYGVRAEGSRFGDLPAYNAAVDSAFGLRTDYLPAETHFSPRAGFT